jgi:hypothetical protein
LIEIDRTDRGHDAAHEGDFFQRRWAQK